MTITKTTSPKLLTASKDLVVTAKEMLDSMNYQPAPSITIIKNIVFKGIANFVYIEGYPGDEVIQEASINDLVYSILNLIICGVKKTVCNNLILLREKNLQWTLRQVI